jgi:Mrp family chromosome partitioning ATPase
MATHAKQRPPAAGEYVRMVWDRRWLIVVMTAIALGIALLTRPASAPITYQATVPIEVRSLTLDGTSSTASALFEVPAAEVDAARSIEVAAGTAEELGMTDGGADLLDRLVVESAEDAPVIYLTLSGDGPQTVDELETYAQRYVEFRRQQDQEKIDSAIVSIDDRIGRLARRLDTLSERLEQQKRGNDGIASPLTSTQYQAVSDLYRAHVGLREEIVLSSALAETRFRALSAPFSQTFDPIPTGTLRVFLFPLAGALLGVAIALTLGVLRPKVYGRQQLEELDVPLLATVPRVGRNRSVRRQPLRVQRTSAWGAEAIGMLRAELHMTAEHVGSGKTRVVAIVSPSSGEGKSTIATNLAAAYAASGIGTVLFRADVAGIPQPRPRARRKGRMPEPDRSTPMRGRSDPAGFDEIFLMPGESGWRQDLIVRAIAKLEQDYEIVVIDTPPLLHTADGIVLAAEAEEVVIVVRDGVTMQDEAGSALELLRRHDVRLVGAVLNGQKVSRVLGLGRSGYSESKGRPTPAGKDLSPYGMNGHERQHQPVTVPGEEASAPPPTGA